MYSPLQQAAGALGGGPRPLGWAPPEGAGPSADVGRCPCGWLGDAGVAEHQPEAEGRELTVYTHARIHAHTHTCTHTHLLRYVCHI